MNNFLKARLDKGITKQQLSERSGVPYKLIHRIELSIEDLKQTGGYRDGLKFKEMDTYTKSILNNIAKVLNSTSEKLLQYYVYNPVGTLMEEAYLKCIIINKEDWAKLKWKDTDLFLGCDGSCYYDIATYLGYEAFAYMNSWEYCYLKDEKLFVFRGGVKSDVKIAQLSKNKNDVVENDGIVCLI